jgi:hypothetical protein
MNKSSKTSPFLHAGGKTAPRFFILLAVLAVSTTARKPFQHASGSGVANETVEPRMLAAAMYCAEPNATADSVRNFSGGLFYKVRYFFGIQDPATDRANELHIASYSRNGAQAWLYEMLVQEEPPGKYTMTWLNTAKLSRSGKSWTVSDTLGGIYSYKRVAKLANAISNLPEIQVPFANENTSRIVCNNEQ